MAMRVVVTGGSGHVGSGVVERLLEVGHTVLNLDRQPPDKPLAPWKYTDLGAKAHVMDHLEGADAVVHLGELPHLIHSMLPEEVYAQNTRVGSIVMNSAVNLGIKKVVYASTCQVYGSWGGPILAPQFLPVTEEHPVQPTNAYAAGKVANEAYLKMLVTENDLGAAIVRFPAVHRRWGRWFRDLTIFRNLREPMDGMATYALREDLAKAIQMLVDSDLKGCEIYNVAQQDVMTGVPVKEYLAVAYPDYPALPDEWPSHGSPISSQKLRKAIGWEGASSLMPKIMGLEPSD
jgi:nucleoside-diphosphate-sugar epimerase